jgi:hypothetical protein
MILGLGLPFASQNFVLDFEHLASLGWFFNKHAQKKHNPLTTCKAIKYKAEIRSNIESNQVVGFTDGQNPNYEEQDATWYNISSDLYHKHLKGDTLLSVRESLLMKLDVIVEGL